MAATQYKTPGVYVEEISKLPPSVAEVSTAIPAFIGCTEKGPEIARIDTMLEFEELFGGPPEQSFKVSTTKDATTQVVSIASIDRAKPAVDFNFLLYHTVSLYFKNGGRTCYIVRVGGHTAAPTAADFEAGLRRVAKEDEPTLLLLTDAVNLPSADYHAVCTKALEQCEELGDRFAILDVKRSNDPKVDDVQAFRDGVGVKALRYGAAYYPYLFTTLTEPYSDTTVSVVAAGAADSTAVKLADIRTGETRLYNQIKSTLSTRRIELPPSGAIAGIYAYTDRTRGVWKAPANMSVTSVIGPVEKISDADQEALNVDPTAGKSVNAIRAFSGKGTLVWGARTLAGNDNEWRYVSVRRLFNLIEESTKKSTAWAVFEPNDETTWLKIKGMIESYLYNLWERGALAGPTSEKAYFVSVGLGRTMTAQDILEGRIVVEIGVAAVRPAEFIVLRFTHKLQEA